jgi:hypothetical protein
MAYTTIDKPDDYFNTVLYSGDNASDRAITGVGFQPDFVWIKNRNNTNNHLLQDSVRGLNLLVSNSTAAEQDVSSAFKSFDSDGFTITEEASWEYNNSGKTYASWNWLANGAGVSNTAGTITSTVSANTTSGFSIVSFTGTGANATVGHGLGVAPKWIIVKSRGVENWRVYSSYLGATKAMRLNGTDAADTDSSYWNGEPTSSVFTVGTNAGTNGSSVNMIAYCFAEKQGFSKFGSYTGNGQDTPNGVFTYLGFTPAFILIKATDINSWVMVDNKRPADSNPVDDSLAADSSAAETTGDINTTFDFLSNGFRTNGNSGNNNSSGQEYIYMAFAENPFVTSTGIPTPAR